MQIKIQNSNRLRVISRTFTLDIEVMYLEFKWFKFFLHFINESIKYYKSLLCSISVKHRSLKIYHDYDKVFVIG